MEVLWLPQGKPGGTIGGVALHYPNSSLFSGHKPSSKDTGFSQADFSPCACCRGLPRVTLCHILPALL